MCEKGVMYKEVSTVCGTVQPLKKRLLSEFQFHLYHVFVFQYTDTELYTQLSYFHYIFDLSKIPASEKSKYALRFSALRLSCLLEKCIMIVVLFLLQNI